MFDEKTLEMRIYAAFSLKYSRQIKRNLKSFCDCWINDVYVWIRVYLLTDIQSAADDSYQNWSFLFALIWYEEKHPLLPKLWKFHLIVYLRNITMIRIVQGFDWFWTENISEVSSSALEFLTNIDLFIRYSIWDS